MSTILVKRKVVASIKYLASKLPSVVLFFLFLLYFTFPVYTADLDDLYQPILKKDRLLYKGDFYNFRSEEEGIHGQVSYDKYEVTPHFYSFRNLLRFSPAPCLELTLDFKETFSTAYEHSTYNPSGDLVSLQDYNLDYFRDYKINLRLRKEPIELYLDILEKRQKGNWNWATYPSPPNYFNNNRTQYEDVNIGFRYISEVQNSQHKSNLSKLKRPLLQDNQVNVELELEYKKGKLKRSTDYYVSGSTYFYNFYHNLRLHFIPKFTLRYGSNKDLELESGLFYTTPLKYKYERKLFYPSGSSQFILGNYKLKDNFYFPFKLNYRPKDNLAISLSSDFNFINQKLDYWQKNTDDTITTYPSKKLTYYNTKPSLKVTYLSDNNKEIHKDEFSSLTKELLLKNQCLIELRYQKDITHLHKNSSNGPQNIIDPYNVFLYPLEYSKAASEYATFFCGNTSRYATNILPQNYYLLEATFIYGLTDSLNLGCRLGYRSSSSLHHFTLHDLQSRFYKFRPYYFFDFLCDWQLTKNSLLSFESHLVPNYTTLLDHGGYPQEFKSKNRYYEIYLTLQILF